MTIEHLLLASVAPEVPNFFTFISKTVNPYLGEKLVQWENIIFSLLAAGIISLFFHLGLKNYTHVPKGLQNFLEWVVEIIKKTILEILGPEGEKFIPFLGTLFLYILVMNWLVLIPFFRAPSSSFNVTLGIALTVFAYVQYLNIKNFGFLGFLHHLAGAPKNLAGWILAPMMIILELITQVSRPFTLALRLFGNIYGEDILIGTFSLFGVALLAHFQTPIGLPLQVPFLLLAIFTGLLQALVFTYLSTIYILLSIPHSQEDH